MAKLSKTKVTYDGETFELGSEEARIIYTALKALNDGTAETDGVGIASNLLDNFAAAGSATRPLVAAAVVTGSGATSFINGGAIVGNAFMAASTNQMYLTSSAAFTNMGGNTGSGDYIVMFKSA